MKLQRFVICMVTIMGLLFSTGQSLWFELESGHTKCIAEDIKSNSITVRHGLMLLVQQLLKLP
ncbi:hypothetical protein Hanom_Chr14g01250561 [Helianthus anomalus]